MYIDLAIVLILLIVVVVFFRKFSSFVYAFAIIDIFLRILSKIESMLNIAKFSNFVNKYFSSSIESIINIHSNGIINTILIWLYIGIYMVFLFYIVRTFFKKKK